MCQVFKHLNLVKRRFTYFNRVQNTCKNGYDIKFDGENSKETGL